MVSPFSRDNICFFYHAQVKQVEKNSFVNDIRDKNQMKVRIFGKTAKKYDLF